MWFLFTWPLAHLGFSESVLSLQLGRLVLAVRVYVTPSWFMLTSLSVTRHLCPALSSLIWPDQVPTPSLHSVFLCYALQFNRPDSSPLLLATCPGHPFLETHPFLALWDSLSVPRWLSLSDFPSPDLPGPGH